MILRWAVAFVWTLAIELPIYALVLAPVLRARWSAVALTLACNLATHPILWLALAALPRGWTAIAVGELTVTLVEAAIAAAVTRAPARATIAALLANAASFASSFVIWRFMR